MQEIGFSMPQPIKLFGVTAALFSVLLSCNLHLAILQGVAYSNMMASFSKEFPLSESIQRTLSGQEPCNLCCAVQDLSTEPSDPEKTAPTETLRVLGILAGQPVVYYQPHVLQVLPTHFDIGEQRFRDPPLRPS